MEEEQKTTNKAKKKISKIRVVLMIILFVFILFIILFFIGRSIFYQTGVSYSDIETRNIIEF